MAERKDISVQAEKAVLAAVLDPAPWAAKGPGYDPLAELRALAEAAGALVVDELIQHRAHPVAGTFIGRGKVDELAMMVQAHEAQVVIFENDLSPSQIRNIEEIVKVKILDRSELILDIFASRARTHEAKLQVELAQLEYTYPRLAGMWTHLERIGAGAGVGTRGPGETQIETDRRIVQNRKAELRREIERIQSRKRREVDKRNTDFFTVGLVGYTNAGKSTLFNTLTGESVFAENLLFATLDTRTRRWDLGGGDSVMLSDTVGFVKNLPHHLVASFRATLEESIHSDLLLIVLDVSDPQAEAHLATVDTVLKEIDAVDQPRLLLLNKIDRVEDNTHLLLIQQAHPNAIPISAARGTGLDKLVAAVREAQRGGMVDLTLRVPMREGKALHMIENRAKVHDRQYDTDYVLLKLTIGQRQLDQLRATGARFEIVESA
ncbi:MAG: GTPase HflX [Planctomycetes bacterium]|nr:GTPase HflX [Planctomycetota bacterium]